MNILIIEDEAGAAERLTELILEHDPELRIEKVIDSVAEAVVYLNTSPSIDLIFQDIYLSDGLAFEIFQEICTDIPIIFTTAYDQYAIRAFEVNSVDYLLKPIRKEDVARALEKFKRIEGSSTRKLDKKVLASFHEFMNASKTYKQHFLIPFRDRLIPVSVDDLAWFELKNGIIHGVRFSNQVMIMEEKSMEELASVLNPRNFYRANRQFTISKKAIHEIEYYFNGRLYVHLNPPSEEKVIVSKEKAGDFKQWLRNL